LSVNSAEKATPIRRATEQAAITPAAKPIVFVEGMRTEISTEASDGALLQRRMPGAGQAVVTMEKPAALAAV
jgi:hypothetical protein